MDGVTTIGSRANKINDTPIGVLKESGSTGTVIIGNTFVNTTALIGGSSARSAERKARSADPDHSLDNRQAVT